MVSFSVNCMVCYLVCVGPNFIAPILINSTWLPLTTGLWVEMLCSGILLEGNPCDKLSSVSHGLGAEGLISGSCSQKLARLTLLRLALAGSTGTGDATRMCRWWGITKLIICWHRRSMGGYGQPMASSTPV